jgi:molecular chaperone DnaJ
VLGVSRNASNVEIKEAYRRLALYFHPDRNQSKQAEERFKEISQAYSVLVDEEKRREYDGAVDQEGAERYHEHSAPGERIPYPDFRDFFKDLGFGLGDDLPKRPFSDTFPEEEIRSPNPGEDITYHVQLNLEDIVSDTIKEIETKRNEVCSECGGRSESGNSETCYACGGSGELAEIARMTSFGRLSTVTSCRICGGLGYLTTSGCRTCGGRGVVERTRRIRVVIPAGVEDGHTLRLQGEGGRGEGGGPPGNIYLVIDVRPHKTFHRKGSNLYVTERISAARAKKGTRLRVPMIDDGIADISVEPGTRSGTLLRLKGKGLPKMGSGPRGDLYVQLEVVRGRAQGGRTPMKRHRRP